MNKRANITNVIVIAIVLFASTIGVFMADKIFYSGIVGTNMLNQTNTSNEIIQNVKGKFDSTFDTAYILIFLGVWLMAFVGALLVRSNRILLFITVLAFAIILVISSFFVSIIEKFQADNVDFVERYPGIDFINTHMMLLSLLFGGTILIGMFLNMGGGGGEL